MLDSGVLMGREVFVERETMQEIWHFDRLAVCSALNKMSSSYAGSNQVQHFREVVHFQCGAEVDIKQR